MLKDDLQRRARRLFSGDHRPDDLDRLFLGLRSHAAKRDCLREVGDFIAHRDEREKGLTTDVARDVFTSLEVWSLGLTGKSPSISDIKKAAYANLRLASDEQLKSGCGFTRSGARTKLERAFKK